MGRGLLQEVIGKAKQEVSLDDRFRFECKMSGHRRAPFWPWRGSTSPNDRFLTQVIPLTHPRELFNMPPDASHPGAPLLRLEVVILDDPVNPYRVECFLNVAQEDQARVLAKLANQNRLYLAFCGDDLTHRFTHVVDHDELPWQYLDEPGRQPVFLRTPEGRTNRSPTRSASNRQSS
jgi:hypothetical protein